MSRILRRPPPANIGKVLTTARPDTPHRFRVTFSPGGEYNDIVSVDVGLGTPRLGSSEKADDRKRRARKLARAYLEEMLKKWPED